MSGVINTMAPVEVKKDLLQKFCELCDEFKRESVNGSIELHYSQGVVAKIYSRKAHS